MSNFGQSHRQTVQDTNEGIVAPPEEGQQTTQGAGVKQQVDQNIGNEQRAAKALIDTAGTVGQIATKESKRREVIEGQKIGGSEEAMEYINATNDTFATKIFGPNATLRAAQETQMETATLKGNQQLRDWVEQEGHRLGPDEFDKKQKEIYEDIVGKYDDGPAKDVIANQYADKLRGAQREYEKAHEIFTQNENLNSYLDKTDVALTEAEKLLGSDDPQQQAEGTEQLDDIMKKPDNMSHEAYESALVHLAGEMIAKDQTAGYKYLKENGAFDEMSHANKKALEQTDRINDIKNGDAFREANTAIGNAAARGDPATVAKLAKDLQKTHPEAFPNGVNSVIAQAEQVAFAQQQAIALNQQERHEDFQKYMQGGTARASLSPASLARASKDAANQIGHGIVRTQQEQNTASGQTEDAQGNRLPQSGDPITDEQAWEAYKADASNQSADWKARQFDGDFALQEQMHEFSSLLDIRNPDEATSELAQEKYKQLKEYENADPDLFMNSFPNDMEFAKYEFIADKMRAGIPLNEATVAYDIANAQRADPILGVETQGADFEKNAGKIGNDFLSNAEGNKNWLGFNKSLLNKAEFNAEVQSTYAKHLERTGGRADLAASHTKRELSNRHGMVGGHFIKNLGEFTANNDGVNPDELLSRMVSDPASNQELKDLNLIPNLITRDDSVLGGKRFNMNTLMRAGGRIAVDPSGKSMYIEMPYGDSGDPIPPIVVGNHTREEFDSMETRIQAAQRSAREAGATGQRMSQQIGDLTGGTGIDANQELDRSDRLTPIADAGSVLAQKLRKIRETHAPRPRERGDAR